MNSAEVLIKFKGDTSDADKATKEVSSSLGGLTKSFTLANLAAKGITKALDIFNEGLDDAISRTDTMNNFPRVMDNLGISAEDSAEVISDLSEKLKGLPTTLDSAAAAVQRFTSKNGDVAESEKLFLAVNNAILAGGASPQIQASALEQLSQAYAKGKPDMIEWRTLMTAMPAQLKQVATAMGYVDSSQLGEAVRSSEAEFSRMMDTMMLMNTEGVNGFKSFETQARSATGGVRTSITNMKTAFVRGIGGIISSVDEALEPMGGLSGVMTTLGKAGEEAFKGIGDILKDVLPVLIEVGKEIMPIIQKTFKTLAPVLKKLVTALLPPLKKILDKLVPVFMRMIEKIMPVLEKLLEAIIPLLDPIADLLLAIVDIQMAIIEPLLEILTVILPPLISILSTLLQVILPVITTLLKGIAAVLKTVFEWVGTLVKSIMNLFGGIVDFVKGTWSTISSFITEPFNIAFGVLREGFNTFKGFISGIFNGIKGIIDGVANFFKTAFQKAADGVKKIFEGVKSTAKNIIDAIVKIIKTPINVLIDGLNLFIKALNKIKIPNWVPGVGGKGLHFDKIPKLEVGTNFVPEDMLAMIHKGEAVVPKKFNPYANGLNASTLSAMNNSGIAPKVIIYNNVSMDPLGQTVSNIKTFSGGAKNDYNYGVGV